MRYALCIADPFNPSSRGACVPVFPAADSQKVTSYSRFTAAIGTLGLGGLSIQPCLANDGVMAFYTNSAYASSAFYPTTGVANTLNVGISTASPNNLPYSTSFLASGLSGEYPVVTGRIVSVGVRISYVGTTMNESGVAYLYADPTHMNAGVLANTPSAMGTFQSAEVCSFTRKPCTLNLFPVSPNETIYGNQYYVGAITPVVYPYCNNSNILGGVAGGTTYTIASVPVGSSPGMILFTGVAGSQVLVEIVQHVEYTGELAGALLTGSDSDQRGFEIVSAAASRLPLMKNTAAPGTTMLSMMKEAISSVATQLKPVAVKFLTEAAIGLVL